MSQSPLESDDMTTTSFGSTTMSSERSSSQAGETTPLQQSFSMEATTSNDAMGLAASTAAANVDAMGLAVEQQPILPIRGTSVYRSKSFIQVFAETKGPPQIAIMCILLAFGFGSTVGVVPAVMSDRYARLHYGYNGEVDCADYNLPSMNNVTKPQSCLAGSADAQNAVAVEQLISNTFTFLTSSLMGSLSDQHGRRGILLAGLFLSALSPCCLVLIQVVPTMSPTWYYATGTLSGLVNWIAVALSALSDVIPSKWRAPSFGLLLAGFSLGFACAPNFALWLGHWHVSILAVAMIWCGFLVVLFFFPETLPPEAAAQATLVRLEQEAQQAEAMESSTTRREHHGHPLQLPSWLKKTLWYLYRPMWEFSILNRNRLFRLLSCLAFFNGMASSGDRTLVIYYVQERIGFTDQDVAKMFMIIGGLGIFVQGVVLKHANDWLGERRLVVVCFSLGVLHNLCYGLAIDATHKDRIFVGAAISSLVSMAFPTISAIKSNNVAKSEQGRIQGALYSLQAIASAIGPSALRFVYHFTKDGSFVGPGSMFVFASGLYAIAAYCGHLLPPEANSKRASDETVGVDLRRGGEGAPPSHDEEEQENQPPRTSAETPLL